MEVDRVVPVAPEHVRLDEVREHEPVVELLQEPLRLVDAVDVRPRRVGLVDVDAGEDVSDLADRVHLVPRLAHERQVVRRGRLQRPVVTVGRSHVVSGLALERARDDAAHSVVAGQDLAGDLAPFVELLERDRVDVRGDLEDRVRGRVDDPLARALMLLAELLDDLGARRRLVTEHSATRAVHERVDHLEREPVRVGRQRLGRDDPHQLPVTRGRVLPFRPLDESARDRRCARLRRATLERLDVAETEGFEGGQVEPADRPRDIAERVGSFVAELGRVGKLSRAHRVQHDDACAGHGAILGRSWTPSSA